MAEWLEQASQRDEMYCHDLDVNSNPMQVELGVLAIGTSVLSRRSHDGRTIRAGVSVT